jgi:hypothetical protein
MHSPKIKNTGITFGTTWENNMGWECWDTMQSARQFAATDITIYESRSGQRAASVATSPSFFDPSDRQTNDHDWMMWQMNRIPCRQVGPPSPCRSPIRVYGDFGGVPSPHPYHCAVSGTLRTHLLSMLGLPTPRPPQVCRRSCLAQARSWDPLQARRAPTCVSSFSVSDPCLLAFGVDLTMIFHSAFSCDLFHCMVVCCDERSVVRFIKCPHFLAQFVASQL